MIICNLHHVRTTLYSECIVTVRLPHMGLGYPFPSFFLTCPFIFVLKRDVKLQVTFLKLDNSFSVAGPTAWNSLSNKLRCYPFTARFATIVKCFFISFIPSYSAICSIILYLSLFYCEALLNVRRGRHSISSVAWLIDLLTRKWESARSL